MVDNNNNPQDGAWWIFDTNV